MWRKILIGALVALASAPLVASLALARGQEKDRELMNELVRGWTYPGAAGSHWGRVGQPPRESYNALLTTRDGMKEVVAYYEQRQRLSLGLEKGQPIALRAGPSERTAVFDDSEGRAVDVRIVVRDVGAHTVSLVISRAAGEELTHIAVVIYER